METKEERQRLMLGGVLVVGVLYGYFGLLLSPIQLGITHAERTVEERNQQIASTSVELRTLREEIARSDRPILDTAADELLATVPKSHLASTPAVLSRILEQQSLAKRSARASMLAPFIGREDLICAGWEVNLEEAGPLQIGQATAALENEFSLSQMSEVSLETNTATGTVSATLMLQIVARP